MIPLFLSLSFLSSHLQTIKPSLSPSSSSFCHPSHSISIANSSLPASSRIVPTSISYLNLRNVPHHSQPIPLALAPDQPAARPAVSTLKRISPIANKQGRGRRGFLKRRCGGHFGFLPMMYRPTSFFSWLMDATDFYRDSRPLIECKKQNL